MILNREADKNAIRDGKTAGLGPREELVIG